MDYRSVYNAHWHRFGERPIDTIKPRELQRYLAATQLARKTRRHVLSVLQLIYAEAVADGIFTSNRLANWKIKKERARENYQADPYTAIERDQLLAWLTEHRPIAWRYFLHGFYSGMRTGELLGLPWADYQPPYAIIKQEMVRRDLRHYDKTDQRRMTPVPIIVQKMLEESPSRAQDWLVHLTEGHMFRDGDWLMKWWRRAHQATGVRRRTNPYPWRTTFISQCISGDIDAEDVARWVGNSPAVIRKHYHKYLPTDDREAQLRLQIEQAIH